MNPTIDNDLQKAIDDITNSTNSDPVFGDAVATPEPIEAPRPAAPVTPPAPKSPSPRPMPSFAAPRMPMPPVGAPSPRPARPTMPAPQRPVMPPAPRPVMPKPEAAPMSTPMPAPVAPSMPEPLAPAPVPPMPTIPEPISEMSISEESIVSINSEPTSEPLREPHASSEMPSNIKDVKEAALRDLAPILSKVDMDSSKKFKLYKDIREELHDNSVIAPAYETAKDIADDRERADALLYLIDSIDNM